MNKILKIGIIMLLIGSGPLILIILASKIGIGDPNPNPVGFGIMAMLTFWPSLALIIIGIILNLYNKYSKR